MLGDGGRLGGPRRSTSEALILMTTTAIDNVLHVWGRGDVIMMSFIRPRFIGSLKLRIHILCARILEWEWKSHRPSQHIVIVVLKVHSNTNSRTNLLILSDWFFNHSLKEFSNPLLFANIVFLVEFLPEPVRVGHSRHRVGNLGVVLVEEGMQCRHG